MKKTRLTWTTESGNTYVEILESGAALELLEKLSESGSVVMASTTTVKE